MYFFKTNIDVRTIATILEEIAFLSQRTEIFDRFLRFEKRNKIKTITTQT